MSTGGMNKLASLLMEARILRVQNCPRTLCLHNASLIFLSIGSIRNTWQGQLDAENAGPGQQLAICDKSSSASGVVAVSAPTTPPLAASPVAFGSLEYRENA